MDEEAFPEKEKLVFVVDIGTTTIKTMLYKADGEPIDGTHEKNKQSVYGIDVVSRVLSAHYKGVFPLQKAVILEILCLLEFQCDDDYELADVSRIIITGNTIMLHLVRGLSVQGFEMAPFTPVTLEEAEIPLGELFTEGMRASINHFDDDHPSVYPPLDTPVYFPPCVDAFIGADAVCAALNVLEGGADFIGRPRFKPRFPLLIADVGTNTEIMLITPARKPTSVTGAESLSDEYEITCCSTAAGPAFEGGVLGGKYTGSSLVHLLAELLKAGAMDETGFLDEKAAEHVCRTGTFIAPGVFQLQLLEPGKNLPVITQDAVRQLQLAKGAVCAAIETLLMEKSLTVDDVGQFVLCGNFGSALDVKEAEHIGLFPAGLASVTEYAGNAAELGARLLMKDEMREKAKKIAASVKLIQLADSSYFARRYIERMNFGV